MELVIELFHTYFRKLHQLVLDADEEDRGRGVLGLVAGRDETEDVEIGIDKAAYTLFSEILEEFQARYPGKLDAQFHHEHNHAGTASEDPKIRIDLDPVDGSDEYRRRIRNSVYSAVSARDAKTMRPLAAATLDIHAGMIYTVGEDRQVTVEFLRSGRKTTAKPAQHTALSDDGIVGAAYVGRMKYLSPWMAAFQDILSREEHQGVSLHGKGGSFVYAFMAAGVFSFYAMPNEPVDEILPGLAFAELAGFPVLVKEEDGRWRPFDIRAHGTQESVPFLVVACTQELARELTDAVDRSSSVRS
ncbi:MAG: hypothetical protein O3A93_07905 [Chloroflexi bacterium]|nr:hypothetical protein [Chloroflexota bacterium]MDA1271169.1 hypothetical protein [Chloroflexota bacterium]